MEEIQGEKKKDIHGVESISVINYRESFILMERTAPQLR